MTDAADREPADDPTAGRPAAAPPQDEGSPGADLARDEAPVEPNEPA